MRETVDVVQHLLAMEKVTFKGEFVQVEDIEIDIVHGDRSPKNVPIYIGATGMKMMELSGGDRRWDIAQLPGLTGIQPGGHGTSSMAGPREQAGPLNRSTVLNWWFVPSTKIDRGLWTTPRELVTQYLGQQPHIMKASGVSQDLLDEIGTVLTWPAEEHQIREAMNLSRTKLFNSSRLQARPISAAPRSRST